MKKKIHDKTFVPFLSAADIQQAVSRMAAQINKDPFKMAMHKGDFP